MDVVQRMNELKANYAQTTGALCEEPVSFFQFGLASASHATCRPHSFKNLASDVDEWDENLRAGPLLTAHRQAENRSKLFRPRSTVIH